MVTRHPSTPPACPPLLEPRDSATRVGTAAPAPASPASQGPTAPQPGPGPQTQGTGLRQGERQCMLQRCCLPSGEPSALSAAGASLPHISLTQRPPRPPTVLAESQQHHGRRVLPPQCERLLKAHALVEHNVVLCKVGGGGRRGTWRLVPAPPDAYAAGMCSPHALGAHPCRGRPTASRRPGAKPPGGAPRRLGPPVVRCAHAQSLSHASSRWQHGAARRTRPNTPWGTRACCTAPASPTPYSTR